MTSAEGHIVSSMQNLFVSFLVHILKDCSEMFCIVEAIQVERYDTTFESVIESKQITVVFLTASKYFNIDLVLEFSEWS